MNPQHTYQPNTVEKNKTIPLLMLMSVSIIWGSGFILIKKGLIAYSPLEVGALRVVFAGIFLVPVAIRNLKPVFKEYWKQLFVLGLISILFPALLVAIAGTKLDSSIMGVLASLNPLFTALIGVAFYKVKPNVPMAIGLLLGLAGSIIISTIDSNGELSTFNYYAIFIFLAAILFAVSGNMIKKFVGRIDPVVLLSLSLLSIMPAALGILISGDFIHHTLTQHGGYYSFAATAGLGLVVNVFAFIIYNKLIKMRDAVFASTSSYLSPIVAIGWGVLDGEILTPLHFVGMLIIATGIVLINRKY